MTSKFACFGPGFLTGFLKVGLPKKPTGFFGYVPGCPNPDFHAVTDLREEVELMHLLRMRRNRRHRTDFKFS